eukprot:COSAG02_NODE_1912_length_10408_cov_8.124551_3_plen_79_part_00
MARGTGARETRERGKGWWSASSSALGRSSGQLGCVGPFVQRWVRDGGRRGGSGSGGPELSLGVHWVRAACPVLPHEPG